VSQVNIPAKPVGHNRLLLVLVLGVILVRLAMAAYFMRWASVTSPRHGKLYLLAGDTNNYLAPAEHLLASGSYIANPSDPRSYADFTPAYGLTYLLFRWPGTSAETARNLLALLQIAVGAFAVICVAGLALLVTGSRSSLVAAILMGTLSAVTAVADLQLLNESLAGSSLVFAAYLAVTGSSQGSRMRVVWGGVCFAYAVFLRPFLVPLMAPFALYILLGPVDRGSGAGDETQERRRSRLFGLPLVLALAFASPLVVVDGLWAARNYVVLQRVVFFQTRGGLDSCPPAEQSAWRWAMSFGGDLVFWKAGTVGAWLYDSSPFYAKEYRFPSAALGPGCSRSDIEEAREQFGRWRDAVQVSPAAGGEEAAQVIQRFDACRVSYERHHPFDHQVAARLRLLRSFVVHSGPFMPLPPFREQRFPSFVWLVKVGQVTLYALTICAGLAGMVLLFLFRRRDAALLGLLALYPLLLWPLALRLVEFRRWVPNFPFLVLAAATCVGTLVDWALSVRRRNSPGHR